MKKTAAFRFLSATLAVLLALNTAAAGRWLRSCWTPPVGAFCDPCFVAPVYESCCEPMPCETAVSSSFAPNGDCGCGGEVIGSAPTTVHGEPTPALAEPEEQPAPQPFSGGFRSDTPAPAPIPNEPPSEDWSTGVEEPAAAEEPVAEEPVFEEPVPAEEPAVDLFNDPTPVVEEPAAQPEMTEPEVTEPADDLFGAPAEEPAVEEPADDLFGDEPMAEEPATEQPENELFDRPAEIIEEPAVEEPADDLFGAPAEEPANEAPADDLFGEPAEEPAAEEAPADDLFGEEPMVDEPAVEEPADDLFGEDPAAEEPANDLFGEEPAADEPAEDLFGEEPMADEPATEESLDDLFGAPADEPAADEPAGDDLFGEEPMAGEPAEDDLFGEEPAADEAPAEDAEDDLFGGFGEEEEEEAAPADETPAVDAAPADEEVEDDLFGGLGAVLREPGGVDSAKDRTWVDNSGRFSTVGRLIAIDGNAIRLAKQGGGVASVPLSRLSQVDLEFVSRQALAQDQVRELTIARGGKPSSDSPKQAKSKDANTLLRTAQL